MNENYEDSTSRADSICQRQVDESLDSANVVMTSSSSEGDSLEQTEKVYPLCTPTGKLKIKKPLLKFGAHKKKKIPQASC